MSDIPWSGKMIDLTLTYSEEISGFEKSSAREIEVDGWNASNLSIYSHAGTHMDAPYHFDVDKKFIDEYKPEELIVPGHVIDLHRIAPNEIITVAMVESQLVNYYSGDAILLRTDWYKRIGHDAYRNALPRIGDDLAAWCARYEVGIIGVEPPSVADVNNLEEVTRIHHILMKGNVTILEGLCNLDQITSKKITLIALPLKIKNGDGAPARVIAIEHL